MTRVLGVDPGLTRCGVAVIEGRRGRPELVAALVVRTDKGLDLPARLLEVHGALSAAIAEHRPDVVAIEQVLFSVNVSTAMATGQAAGVAMLAGAASGLPVLRYSPTEIKLTVAGHGNADKDAVTRLVTKRLRLDRAPKPADVADAMAVALCAHERGVLRPSTLTAGSTAGPTSGRPRTWEDAIRNGDVRIATGTTRNPA